MASKQEYEYKKLNELLNTSFNNVKYDIRGLNERMETLKTHLANLSADSVYKALDEQNKVILEQQRSINLLMTKFESLQTVKTEQKFIKVAQTQKSVYEDIKEGQVKITKIQLKAPGNGKRNLNGEWVEITGYNVDMTGFKLHDKRRKHAFKFPKGYVIYGPVKVFSGKGKDTNTKLFWNSPRPIWNDEGEIATLRDSKNRVVSKVRSEPTYTFDVLK
ncbi:MAG: lamin tail domain-containing protein [Candidatus Nanoarchaeia archaeon]